MAELGLFSLIIALLFSLLMVIAPSMSLLLHRFESTSSPAVLTRYAFGQFLFLSLSYLALTICFLNDDFTVRYVLLNSSLSLPWFYKLCAVWGGHEGSMLLWVCILSTWTLAVALFSRQLDAAFRMRVLMVLGGLCVGFILFLLMTSNPFLRQFDVLNSQGRDLNPLLQDPGFLFHPPMLYMGYVGFAVAFSFAISALWLGRSEMAWARWTRPWTLAAWCCLTIGITLGSWWAYRELGWGGWWFWDPVENASFMPWLVGTALIHSLIVSEKRQQFKAWTILLAIAGFSLSLIGTFLVRSGVLTSVHAFAVDPQRGIFILGFLFVVIGGSLLLFALRAQQLSAQSNVHWFSRESFLLMNNLLLSVSMLTVLLGTLYPLIIDAFSLGKLSVGSPYFNAVFVPLMIPLFILMGIGIHLRWRQDQVRSILRRLIWVLIASVSLALLICVAIYHHVIISAFIGLLLAGWIILSTLKMVYTYVRLSRGFRGLRPYWGMIIAHCGVAVTIIGIAVSSGYGVQRDVRMSPGDVIDLAGYQIAFTHETSLRGANYHGTEAQFTVTGRHKTVIYPQKRIYDIGQMAMTESAIDVSPFRDVYIALGEPLDNHSWSVRLYYKPLIRWIWGGGFMMLAGGLFALIDRRFKHKTVMLKGVTV